MWEQCMSDEERERRMCAAGGEVRGGVLGSGR